MFGSDSFPLGPNGQFPKQRIRSAGQNMIPPKDVEGAYVGATSSRLPIVEKDFHSSIQKTKIRTNRGRHLGWNKGRDIDRFRPRYAPPSSLRGVGCCPVGGLSGFLDNLKALMRRVRG